MNYLDRIVEYLHYHPGMGRTELMSALDLGIGDTMMKRVLADGIARGDLRLEGKARATRYFLTVRGHLLRTVDLDSYYSVGSDERAVQRGYNFELIRDELPKIDLFTEEEKLRIKACRALFDAHMKDISPGIYNREMERLGIDLSWKSAQIEGNTYTLIETETLLKELKEAKGRSHEEARMLLNHKSALKAIIERPQYFERLSLARMEDIHGVLVEGMNVDPALRHRRVRITGTNYQPLEIESQIREAVEDMCALVNCKENPYEKALLALLLISYIQPFEDGNKRTSRLVSNALLMAYGCCPLTFRSVDANDYRAALLLFYEQNNLSAFKKMFLGQVEFSAHEYF